MGAWYTKRGGGGERFKEENTWRGGNKNKQRQIMKKILFVFCIFIVACSIEQEQRKKIDQQQLDFAKYELYKINSFINCNCSAIKIAEIQGENRDTIPMLSTDIDLDTIKCQNDTVIYYFNYTKLFEDKRILQILSSPYNGCAHYYAIAFKKSESVNKSPLFSLIDEFGIFVYTPQKRVEIEKGFSKCISTNYNQLNSWLKNYLKLNNHE